MLIPNHPHDERLSALASGDPEAVADSALSEHVASCARCTDSVAELGALRASLAELPDLRPHRPLQLLPPVTDAPPSRVDRVGGWARRFFAPVLTAGAALAMVGLVGTTAPLIGPTAQPDSAGAPGDAAEMAQPESTAGGRLDSAAEAEASDGAHTLSGDGSGAAPEGGEQPADVQPLESDRQLAQERSGTDEQTRALTEDRPVWPMILFTGVAIMVAAALLRWIFAPRAA